MAILDEHARGVYIITVTPFTEAGALDLTSTDRMIEAYLEAGVSGLTILGILGEAGKLTAQEARTFAQRVIERLVQRQAKRLREIGAKL